MGENNLCSENLYVGNQMRSNTCMTHGRNRFPHEQSSWEKRPCSSCLACAMGEIAGTTSRARGRSGHVPACSIKLAIQIGSTILIIKDVNQYNMFVKFKISNIYLLNSRAETCSSSVLPQILEQLEYRNNIFRSN